MRSSHVLVKITVLSTLVALSLASCKDAGPGPDATENLSLNTSASHSHTSPTSPDHQVLVITSVKVLVRDIRFKEAISGDSSDVKSGSFVMDLKLDGSVTNVARVRIRPGIYEHLRLTIHKPEGDEPVSDPDFRNGTASGLRYSVVVTGFYHETPFVFRSRVNAHHVLMLPVPVKVPQDGYVNLTLKIDPYEWFTAGELILDPFIQTDQIDNRVISSFGNVFQDWDGNGQPE